MLSYLQLRDQVQKLDSVEGSVVGQIPNDKLKCFYELVVKANKINESFHLDQKLELYGWVSGDANENDSNYRGPYTSIHYANDIFTAKRIASTNEDKNGIDGSGQFIVLIRSNDADGLLLFISELSKIANVEFSFEKNKNGKFDVTITIKDLQKIAQSEIPVKDN